MLKPELIKSVTDLLKEKNKRKPVSIPKQTFHITNDEGVTKTFHVQKNDRNILYTSEDTANILDAYFEVVSDAIKRGERITIKGFGTYDVHHRKERRTKNLWTGEDVIVADRYVPKFFPSKTLKMCAKVYELSLKENGTYPNGEENTKENDE